MKKKCDYRLRAGFIIACPEFRNGKIFTNDNLTNEVAREYLAKYPQQEKYFSVIPEAENAEGEESEKPTKKKSIKITMIEWNSLLIMVINKLERGQDNEFK